MKESGKMRLKQAPYDSNQTPYQPQGADDLNELFKEGYDEAMDKNSCKI